MDTPTQSTGTEFTWRLRLAVIGVLFGLAMVAFGVAAAIIYWLVIQ